MTVTQRPHEYHPGCCSMEPAEHDLSMMRDPDAWPAWPVLPLKRATGRPYEMSDVGFMLEQPEGEPKVVYLATIFEVKEVLRDPSRQKRYDSFEAVYDDGWRVD